MRINTGLKVLAGAVALALSGGAFAATGTLANGSVVLILEDTTQGTQYVYDTSILASGGNPSSFSKDLSGDANYIAFENTILASDNVSYSVLGANSSDTILTTAVTQPTTKTGAIANNATVAISTFLSQVNNPNGGSTFTAAGDPATAKWAAQYEPGYTNNLGNIADGTAVGTALGFYQILTSSPSSTKSGAVTTALASTWTLSSAGVLTYGTTTAPVPLPAPLVLLLSGLGLMGVVARRRQSASSDASFNGFAA